nr:MAG TPA: hypothetical protein [Caudoviricetes sp.]
MLFNEFYNIVQLFVNTVFSFNYLHTWLKLYFYFPFNLLPLLP